MATSGPSEPWRNADDFAECVATKGENITPASTAAIAVAATSTPVALDSLVAPAGAATAYKASMVNGGGGGGSGDFDTYQTGTSTQAAASTTSDAFSYSLSVAGGIAGSTRCGSSGRSSAGFDVGGRRGGALALEESGGGGGGFGGGGGGVIESGTSFRAFDSIPVDLGSV